MRRDTGLPLNKPFAVKDCALAAIATGKRAQNLKELRNTLQTIDPGSIYYHFWGTLLRPIFEDPEYNNDFASWIRHGLHDAHLAERLSVVDPTDYKGLEELRQKLLDIIDERLDESEFLPWSKPDNQFYFIRSQIVVFDTHQVLHEPRELATVVPSMSAGSIFYHFIDARRRTWNNLDDLRAWLEGFADKHVDLCDRLAEVDPFFPTLTELRSQLAAVFEGYFEKGNA